MNIKNTVQDLIFGRGDTDAVPVSNFGWERVALILRQDYAVLIGLNLMFVVCCLPLFTIPAAFSGMHRVILNYVRSRNQPVIQSFFQEFRTEFISRACVGLLLLLAPVSLAFYPRLLGWNNLSLAVLIISGIFVFCLASFYFPLLVLQDLPIGTVLKNALFMMFISWKTTIRILGTAGVLYGIAVIFPLYAIPFFIIILFSFCCLICCSFFNEAFHELFEKNIKCDVVVENEEK